MNKWIFLVISGFLIAPAYAGEFQLDINLASKHFIDTPGTLGEYNERNYGIGIEYRIGKYHLIAGEYDNSINSKSYYAGLGRSFISGSTDLFWKRYEIGADLVVANGYKDFVSEDGRHWKRSSDHITMGGPYIRFGDIHAIKLRYAISVATAGYQYRF